MQHRPSGNRAQTDKTHYPNGSLISGGLHPPLKRGPGRELGPVGNSGLLQQLADVELDRVVAEVELLANFTIRRAIDEKPQDPDLAVVQLWT